MRNDNPAVRKKSVALTAAAMLLATWSTVYAAEPSAHDEGDDDAGLAMVADLVIARPLGLVATVLGAAFFTVGLPIELMIGDVETPARKLIAEPAWYTFKRPLGDLTPDRTGYGTTTGD